MSVNNAEVRMALTAMLQEIREVEGEVYADNFNLGFELDSIQILQLIGVVHERFGLLFGQDTTDITLLDSFSSFSEWVSGHAKYAA